MMGDFSASFRSVVVFFTFTKLCGVLLYTRSCLPSKSMATQKIHVDMQYARKAKLPVQLLSAA